MPSNSCKNFRIVSCTVHVEVISKLKDLGQGSIQTDRRSSKCEKNSHLWFTMRRSSLETYSRLSYVGQDCERIPAMLHTLYGPQVCCLDLSFNALISLRGLTDFPNLEELVLDNNLLNDTIQFPRLNKLHTLSLNKNKIVNLDLLLVKISNHLPKLGYLSLLGNLACPNQLSDSEKDEEDYRRYRYYVLHHLPKLQFLDSSKVSFEERMEAERRGQFMKVVRPSPWVSQDDEIPADCASPYSPLPRTKRGAGDHQGAYGKCRYRYSGKHSEGNRFIANSDL